MAGATPRGSDRPPGPHRPPAGRLRHQDSLRERSTRTACRCPAASHPRSARTRVPHRAAWIHLPSAPGPSLAPHCSDQPRRPFSGPLRQVVQVRCIPPASPPRASRSRCPGPGGAPVDPGARSAGALWSGRGRRAPASRPAGARETGSSPGYGAVVPPVVRAWTQPCGPAAARASCARARRCRVLGQSSAAGRDRATARARFGAHWRIVVAVSMAGTSGVWDQSRDGLVARPSQRWRASSIPSRPTGGVGRCRRAAVRRAWRAGYGGSVRRGPEHRCAPLPRGQRGAQVAEAGRAVRPLAAGDGGRLISRR